MESLIQMGRRASAMIDQVLADPSQYTEAVLDQLQATGRDTTDLEVVWQEASPLGGERLADLSSLAVVLEGPGTERGPTPEERREVKEGLARGDRVSSLSRPTQWVVSSSRGKKVVCWGVQHAPGVEEDPACPLSDVVNGWAVWELTTASHLRREGRALTHCVGNPSMGYVGRVRSGAISLYSVRKDGAPICTVEVTDGVVTATQGKSGLRLNQIPEAQATWARWRG